MTPEDVRKSLAEIEAAKGDNEDAHQMEDRLHKRVLYAISEGLCTDPKLCATLALELAKISFVRWYA